MDNKDIDASDSFFYSRKGDIEDAFQKAYAIDKELAEKIANDNELSLIEKLSELELIKSVQ